MKRTFLLALVACGLAIGARAAGPVFTIFPASSTNLAGTDLEFTVRQSGSEPDPVYQYQWQRGATNLLDDDRIQGTTNAALTIASAQLEDSGVYRAGISSNGVFLAWATSTVYIVSQPAIQNVYLTPQGAGVAFTAEATGGLLSYQWLWQGQPIPGATTSSLRYTDAYAGANAGYYSVVVTNVIGEADSSGTPVLFTKPVPAGTYQGIFWMEDGVRPETAGSFQYTVSQSRRSYSGVIISGRRTWRVSGAFNLAHTSKLSLPRPDAEDLVMAMQFITTNSNPQILGTINDGENTGFIEGNRLAFGSSNPTPLSGRYTLALQNTNPPVSLAGNGLDEPFGDSIAALTISRSGIATFSGRTADGAAFGSSRGLSRLGYVPLHAQAYNSRAQLLGWIRVQKQSGGSIRGENIAWMKYPGADRRFPDGFAVNLKAIGSTYVPTNTPALAFTEGVATLYGGDLFDADGAAIFQFARVTLHPPAALVGEPSVDRLRLEISRSTGTVKGDFIDLATGLRSPILAILLPQQNCARGYFLSTNTAGAFTLMPAAK